jgi:hypothetical protein
MVGAAADTIVARADAIAAAGVEVEVEVEVDLQLLRRHLARVYEEIRTEPAPGRPLLANAATIAFTVTR